MTKSRRIHSLPIFAVEDDETHVFYAPGYAAMVPSSSKAALMEALTGSALDCGSTIATTAALLRNAAVRAADEWQQHIEAPFLPECLTVYLSNDCALACSYCWAAADSTGAPRRAGIVVSEQAVRAAASFVAESVRKRNEPLRVVIHGGGEPSSHWQLLQRVEETTRSVAAAAGVGWWGYMATAGTLSKERASWLARHFDLVGLSCDGPPDIQDRQRPRRNGRESSTAVERTARAIRDGGGSLMIRATITPATVDRQSEIVGYCCDRLGPVGIRFEPVYRLGNVGGFQPCDAERFVHNFVCAVERAERNGGEVSLSGVRIDELHGPYCEVLRQTLHVLPDGTAASCFLMTQGDALSGNPARALTIGRLDPKEGRFEFDYERIQALKRAAGRIPSACQECLSLYHCARDCPEGCSVKDDGTPGGCPQTSFRCAVYRQVAEFMVLKAARRSRASSRSCELSSVVVSSAELSAILRDAPSQVDGDAIVAEWHRSAARRSIASRGLPAPLWRKRGYDHDGPKAFEAIVASLQSECGDDCSSLHSKAMSIYVHVPFCSRRCSFCDCYAEPLPPSRRDRESQFVEVLLQELEAFAAIDGIGGRPVTTVHFGGGTPAHLETHSLERILCQLRGRFRVVSSTELAVELTSELSAEPVLKNLRELGFARVHVGVQTLEAPVRRLIGRRSRPDLVLERLGRARALGYIVSVDVVFGLPDQTLPGLIHTIRELAQVGVSGVSLYHFNLSERNRAWFEGRGFDRNPLRDYVLLLAAEQCLRNCGFRKTHFTHHAKPDDTNLYDGHVQRGEDLLGVGPTADGVFRHYHFRHPELGAYIATARSGLPPLEGGVAEQPSERRLATMAARLTSGEIAVGALESLGAGSLVRRWSEEGLLVPSETPGLLRLTASGSWFFSDMLAELEATAASGRAPC